MTEPIRVFARSKVNLSLHVTGRRSDGYRLLDSLVVFPEIGDVVTVEPSDEVSLDIKGPTAGALTAEPDNLVLRAAGQLWADGTARITLDKALPVAAGIGGGSADAAAALHALSLLWRRPVNREMALSLGADVPVCLSSRSCRMQGIGEVLSPVLGLPEFWIVLVNSGTPVPTRAVFDAMTSDDNPAMPPVIPAFSSTPAMARWLAEQRNDMQAAACEIDPGIRDVLAQLTRQNGCLLARMSGSGGTCFGLFPDRASARAAADTINRANPDWWCAAAEVRSGSGDPGHHEIGQLSQMGADLTFGQRRE